MERIEQGFYAISVEKHRLAGLVLKLKVNRKEELTMEGIMTKESTIYITEVDLARLRKLIEAARDTGIDANTPYLNKLEDELDRANIVDPKEIPMDAITMRSKVRLKDLERSKEMIYSLVFPNEADVDEGRISVLAPVGTAMIGYRVGDIIEWEVPSGLRRLKVEEVLYQPEASGDYQL
jgi:regulator of nucleoside diphosphate kinase